MLCAMPVSYTHLDVYKRQAQISHAKDELVTPDEMLMNAADFNEKKVAEIYREYQISLRRNNAFDFDDLIVKTVELFQNCGEVLESYQERFRYIMVDEYQDCLLYTSGMNALFKIKLYRGNA